MNTGILLSVFTLIFGLGASENVTNVDTNLSREYQLQVIASTANEIENTASLANAPQFYDCDDNSPKWGTNRASFTIENRSDLQYTYQGKDLLVMDTKTSRIKDVFTNPPLTNHINPKKGLLVFNQEGGFAHLAKSVDQDNILFAEIYSCVFNDEYGDVPSDVVLNKLLRIDLDAGTNTTFSIPNGLQQDDLVGSYNFIYRANDNVIQIAPEELPSSLPRLVTNYEYSYLEPNVVLPQQSKVIWPATCTGDVSGFVVNTRPNITCPSTKGGAVSAAMDGKVVETSEFSDFTAQFGTYVIIDHGNSIQTIYNHLDSLNVQQGQSVKAGQKIGTIGASGGANGPLLSFATTFRGYYFDPFRYSFANAPRN